MFYFPFAPTPPNEDGTFNEGDVPTWDGERWVGQPGGSGTGTWSEALSNGNATEGRSGSGLGEGILITPGNGGTPGDINITNSSGTSQIIIITPHKL